VLQVPNKQINTKFRDNPLLTAGITGFMKIRKVMISFVSTEGCLPCLQAADQIGKPLFIPSTGLEQ
jgi:hypothetical protein